MWNKDIIAICDLKLFKNDEEFLSYIQKLSKSSIKTIIFRAKHLKEYVYYDIAKEVLSICNKNKITCFLHNFYDIALKLGHRFLHCPIDILDQNINKYFKIIGTSIHDTNELQKALDFKCNYAIFGHVFESNSKPNLSPKGLNLLELICNNGKIPIYAIGGINIENIASFKDINIAGVCMMSALNSNNDLKKYIKNCYKRLNS